MKTFDILTRFGIVGTAVNVPRHMHVGGNVLEAMRQAFWTGLKEKKIIMSFFFVLIL